MLMKWIGDLTKIYGKIKLLVTENSEEPSVTYHDGYFDVLDGYKGVTKEYVGYLKEDKDFIIPDGLEESNLKGYEKYYIELLKGEGNYYLINLVLLDENLGGSYEIKILNN